MIAFNRAAKVKTFENFLGASTTTTGNATGVVTSGDVSNVRAVTGANNHVVMPSTSATPSEAATNAANSSR